MISGHKVVDGLGGQTLEPDKQDQIVTLLCTSCEALDKCPHFSDRGAVISEFYGLNELLFTRALNSWHRGISK